MVFDALHSLILGSLRYELLEIFTSVTYTVLEAIPSPEAVILKYLAASGRVAVAGSPYDFDLVPTFFNTFQLDPSSLHSAVA